MYFCEKIITIAKLTAVSLTTTGFYYGCIMYDKYTNTRKKFPLSLSLYDALNGESV